MQQVLNSQDRNQAFLKFLLFFIITVILIIVAIFFDYRMPIRENRMLQDEVDVQRQRETNQQKFVQKLDEVLPLLDSIGTSGANNEILKVQVSGKINDLSGLQENSNTVTGKMNKVIIEKLTELMNNKNQLMEMDTKVRKYDELQTELRDCKTNLKNAQDEIKDYRAAGN